MPRRPMSDAAYPRPGQLLTKGDASEIECPSCGLANDIADEDPKRNDEFCCSHCDQPFVVTSAVTVVTVSTIRSEGT